MSRKRVAVVVDRPMGSVHPQYPDLVYPVNYGYVPGAAGGDGEEQDAYILGVEEPVSGFTGVLAAVIHRFDDQEDKWVVTPEQMHVSREEIERQTFFQERFFRTAVFLEE